MPSSSSWCSGGTSGLWPIFPRGLRGTKRPRSHKIHTSQISQFDLHKEHMLKRELSTSIGHEIDFSLAFFARTQLHSFPNVPVASCEIKKTKFRCWKMLVYLLFKYLFKKIIKTNKRCFSSVMHTSNRMMNGNIFMHLYTRLNHTQVRIVMQSQNYSSLKFSSVQWFSGGSLGHLYLYLLWYFLWDIMLLNVGGYTPYWPIF